MLASRTRLPYPRTSAARKLFALPAVAVAAAAAAAVAVAAAAAAAVEAAVTAIHLVISGWWISVIGMKMDQ